MKKFTVLQAHQGDKLYVPGDPETGTRIADPNEVTALVAAGFLKEAGDAPAAAPVISVDDTAAQIRELTSERDAARADLASARSDADVAASERDELKAEVEQLKAARFSGRRGAN
jgi:hypothetical protein